MKPMLVGESNPYGSDPYYALYPMPDGCSGHRLCCLILGMQQKYYLEVFDRMNLVNGTWSAKAAREKAKELWSRHDAPRFILLGSKVCAAFQVPFVPFEISKCGTMLVLPHPSGRNLMWNQSGMFEKVRESVASFLPETANLLGVTT